MLGTTYRVVGPHTVALLIEQQCTKSSEIRQWTIMWCGRGERVCYAMQSRTASDFANAPPPSCVSDAARGAIADPPTVYQVLQVQRKKLLRFMFAGWAYTYSEEHPAYQPVSVCGRSNSEGDDGGIETTGSADSYDFVWAAFKRLARSVFCTTLLALILYCTVV